MAVRERDATHESGLPADDDDPTTEVEEDGARRGSAPRATTIVTVSEAPVAPSYPWDKALAWLDRHQAKLPPVAFGGAVLKKAGEDQVSLLAAVMSHFGMLSIFPLLLLLVTAAGYLFHDDDAAQQALIDAALDNFPVLGDYLRASVQALPGSGIALLFGLVLLLWASLGFTKAAQVAMADVWGVPRRLRPGFWQLLGRSVWALGMLALPTVLTATVTIVTGWVADEDLFSVVPGWVQITAGTAAVAVAAAFFLGVNFASHLLAFRALTPKSVGMREMIPGTILFTLFWTALTVFGSALISNRLVRANQLYGTIGFVIGLIFWIYLGAYGSLLSAEVNAVRSHRLYPRSLFGPPRTSIDRQALRERARTEELFPGQVVDVRFDEAIPPADPVDAVEPGSVGDSADQAAGHDVVDAGEGRGPERP
jgi:YihY family inner membrane protein